MSTADAPAPTSRRRSWPALLVFVALCAAVAAAGAASSAGSRETCAALETPSWAPPGSIFGPVWTVLYVMIAVAGWLLVPYLAWVTVATALNAAVVRLS